MRSFGVLEIRSFRKFENGDYIGTESRIFLKKVGVSVPKRKNGKSRLRYLWPGKGRDNEGASARIPGKPESHEITDPDELSPYSNSRRIIREISQDAWFCEMLLKNGSYFPICRDLFMK